MKVKLCLVRLEILHLYLGCTVAEHKVYKEVSVEPELSELSQWKVLTNEMGHPVS